MDFVFSLPHSIKTSGFWNIFTPETIGLLDDVNIGELRRSGFERNNFFLEQGVIEKVDYYAGNFPFFNQIVCRHIFDAKVYHMELDEDTLQIELLPHYKNLWKNRTGEEQKLLRSLKKRKVVKRDSSLKEMRARGILKKTANFYLPFSKFFFDLINDRTIDVDNSILDKVLKPLKYTLAVVAGVKGLKVIAGFVSSVLASHIANQIPEDEDGDG